MSRWILLPLTLALAATAAAAEGVERFTLDNGVRVVLHPIPKSGGATVAIAFATGRDDDPPDALGRAHLIEHLLLRAPTPSHPEHGGAFEALGGLRRVNGATMLGATYAYVMTRADDLGRVGAILAEQIRAAKITEEAIALEAKRIREQEIANVERRTAFVLLEATMRAAYPERGIGHPSVLGEEPGKQPVEAVAKRFASAHYDPRRLVVAVTGEVDAAAVRRALKRSLGALPPRATAGGGEGGDGEAGEAGEGGAPLVPAARPSPAPGEGARSVRVASPAGDAAAVFVYDLGRERHAGQVAAQMLQMKVFAWRVDPERADDPIATASTGAQLQLGASDAAFAVHLTRRTPAARDALVAKWEETLATLAEEGVTAAQIAPIKSGLIAGLNPENQATQLAFVPTARRAMAVAQLAINHALSEATAGPTRDDERRALEAIDAEAVTTALRRWAKEGPRAEGRADP